MAKACKVCGRAAAQRRSRCATCSTYWYTNKKERPPELHNRSLPVDRNNCPAWCDVCGNTALWRGNKCQACYQYWQANRKKRPRYLWDTEMGCKCCGVPLSSVGYQKSGKRRTVRGFCLACYEYRRTNGKARPRHLWGIGPAGWCECGYPAVAVIDKDLPVCERHRE